MNDPEKPWRTRLEIDMFIDSDDEIRAKVAKSVSEALSGRLPGVELVFSGLDGSQIGQSNLPPVKGATIYARELEDIAGTNELTDPLSYATDYDFPALAVYDKAMLHTETEYDSGEYDHSDDAVLGVIFIDNA